MKKKGFTLIELLVVIAIIAMLLAILMPALNKVKKIAQRVVCGTNLKGLGTAQMVYANDYEDSFTIQGGTGIHAWDGTPLPGWQDVTKDWSLDSFITIGASLYLLVREADVSPKSFVCGGGSETDFDGTNDVGLDITELWDFGNTTGGPRDHVSYSYQMPYGDPGGAGRYAADGTKSAAFAIMSDKNPWYDPKLLPEANFDILSWTDYVRRMGPYYRVSGLQKAYITAANTEAHSREGQNVLFGDGHSAYEKTTDIGVRHDGIYVIRGAPNTANPEDPIRMGDAGYFDNYVMSNALQPRGGEDSFLVNDDQR